MNYHSSHNRPGKSAAQGGGGEGGVEGKIQGLPLGGTQASLEGICPGNRVPLRQKPTNRELAFTFVGDVRVRGSVQLLLRPNSMSEKKTKEGVLGGGIETRPSSPPVSDRGKPRVW